MHQQQRVGSLPPPAPLSYCAPSRRTGGGHARRSLASPCRIGRGKSVSSRVQCGVRRKSLTTTARAPPSERQALWLLKARATWTRHRGFLVARWSVYTALTPRGGNRRSFPGHRVRLFLAPIHPRVYGEQDRDQYSRMAEDGPSLGGDRGGSWVCGGPRGRRSIRTLVYGPCRSGKRRPTASTESRCMGVRLPLPDDIHSGGCLDATGSTAGCARGRLHFKEGAIFGRSDGHSPQQWFGEKL